MLVMLLIIHDLPIFHAAPPPSSESTFWETMPLHLGMFPISSVQVILHKLPCKTILRLGDVFSDCSITICKGAKSCSMLVYAMTQVGPNDDSETVCYQHGSKRQVQPHLSIILTLTKAIV